MVQLGDTGLGRDTLAWGRCQGQVAGTGTWGGFRGQVWWIRTRESDLQGLAWGHGTGT